MQDYQFEFDLTLEKAESREGRMFVSGVASTTSVDQQNESFSPNALKAMADGAVGKPFVTSHNHELGDEIGTIHKATVEGNRLMIEGELDADDMLAQRLFKKIQKSQRAGFSVGAQVPLGAIKRNGSHRVLDDVRLNHVMITSKPVNKDCFAVAISKALHSAEDLPIMDIEQNETSVEKAGAKFSDDTMNQLKGIHAAAPDSVKSMIQDMVGPAVDASFWSTPEPNDDGHSNPVAADTTEDTPAVPVAPESPDSNFVGVTHKAEIEAAVQAALSVHLADLAEKQDKLANAIAAFKSETEALKQVGKAVDAAVPVAKASALELRKAHRNESDLISHLLLRASTGG